MNLHPAQPIRRLLAALLVAGLVAGATPAAEPAADDAPGLSVRWADRMLTVSGPGLPDDGLRIWYLEAYCRPGSTDRDWDETVIPHAAQLVEADPDGRRLHLRDVLADGVIVDHHIEAGVDAVRFRIEAHNPTATASQAHWAQPCVRVAPFAGVPETHAAEAYLPNCFVVIDGKPRFLPTQPWATRARYVPGQVYCPASVPRDDVNPRPLSALVPSAGLMGCRSADGKHLLAIAFEPCQELFQGVIVCIHADFRIGGLLPGESKTIRGRLYVVPNDLDALLARYRHDLAPQP
jgi:hypothetical protein